MKGRVFGCRTGFVATTAMGLGDVGVVGWAMWRPQGPQARSAEKSVLSMQGRCWDPVKALKY